MPLRHVYTGWRRGKPRRQGKHLLHPEKVPSRPDFSRLRVHSPAEWGKAQSVGAREYRMENK